MIHQHLALEYEQINENIRWLADIRFKLLALVPLLGGVAAFLLTQMGLESSAASAGQPAATPIVAQASGPKTAPATAAGPSLEETRLPIVLAGSVLGFTLALGMTLYDQRNSELYNALIHRAKHLEAAFESAATPGALRIVAIGGQFNERPPPSRMVLLRAKHDVALALIYGSLLASWSFPIAYVAAKLLLASTHHAALTVAVLVAFAMLLAFAGWLITVDRASSQQYSAAAVRDGLA